MKRPQVTIEVYQQDFIPGFAAFRNNGQIKKNAHAHVVLNIGDFLATVKMGEIEAKDLPYVIAESLMHEVVHVFEAWAGVEFSEEKVEALIEKYQQKYGVVDSTQTADRAAGGECCEWVATKTETNGIQNYRTGCHHIHSFMSDADCPYCGKPIHVKES